MFAEISSNVIEGCSDNHSTGRTHIFMYCAPTKTPFQFVSKSKLMLGAVLFTSSPSALATNLLLINHPSLQKRPGNIQINFIRSI